MLSLWKHKKHQDEQSEPLYLLDTFRVMQPYKGFIRGDTIDQELKQEIFWVSKINDHCFVQVLTGQDVREIRTYPLQSSILRK